MSAMSPIVIIIKCPLIPCERAYISIVAIAIIATIGVTLVFVKLVYHLWCVDRPATDNDVFYRLFDELKVFFVYFNTAFWLLYGI